MLETDASHQDQHASATNSLTQVTYAKFAQPANCLTVEELDAYQEPTLATPDNKFKETSSHAMLAELAHNSRLQIEKEQLAFQDLSLSADVWPEETILDINAFHAQLDKSPIQTIQVNVLLNCHATIFPSDLLEIEPTVLVASNATSQLKSQINNKLNAS